MLFFDCTYIVCCNFYKKREKDIFKVSGLILMSLLLTLNITFIFFIIEDLRLIELSSFQLKLFLILLLFLIIMPLLYLRYFRFTNYNEINNSLYHKYSNIRPKIYVLSIVYTLTSILSTIGYALYKGGIINGWW